MPSPLDSITWNTSQPDPNVTYSFLNAGTNIMNDGNTLTSVEATDFFMSQVTSIFSTISSITNLTFTLGTGETDFRLMLTDDLDAGADGFMNPPAEDGAGLGVFSAPDEAKFETGAYNYMVLVHEIMHGLGLAHPHDDGGGSTIMDGVTTDFGDYGDFDLNQGVYTVMTYNNGFAGGDAAPDAGFWGYEMGPMALDIAVLQDKYGANTSTATGDGTYVLNADNAVGTGWTTIWDAGGTDMINYDGALDVSIDLRAASLQSAVGGGGYVSSAAGIAGGFTIANGVVIENADGGGGSDTLRGNSVDNTLTGKGGTDTLLGGGGDDALKGSNGTDSLRGNSGMDDLKGGKGRDDLNGGSGADKLNGGAGNDVLRGGKGDDDLNGGGGNDFLKGGAGADTLKGGAGADTFVFGFADAGDVIVDFATGEDKIRFVGLSVDVNIEQQNGQYAIQLDLDGDGIFDDGLIMSVQEVMMTDISM